MSTLSYAVESVLDFYKSLPFNYRCDISTQARNDVRSNPVEFHSALAPLVRPRLRVLDLGCGAGWFSNALAAHNDILVTGVDFNPVAVERARQVAACLGLSSQFHCQDMFTYKPEEPFDLVVSLGALHHTGNCGAALRNICRNLVIQGGHIYIGLYHAYGRKPFLEHFANLKRQGADEEKLFREYVRLHKQLDGDETMQRSWFRDQVQHPHETQHTQKEMNSLLKEEGMRLVSSSINRFQAFATLQELEAAEPEFETRGYQALRHGAYFPGFFIFLAQK